MDINRESKITLTMTEDEFRVLASILENTGDKVLDKFIEVENKSLDHFVAGISLDGEYYRETTQKLFEITSNLFSEMRV